MEFATFYKLFQEMIADLGFSPGSIYCQYPRCILDKSQLLILPVILMTSIESHMVLLVFVLGLLTVFISVFVPVFISFFISLPVLVLLREALRVWGFSTTVNMLEILERTVWIVISRSSKDHSALQQSSCSRKLSTSCIHLKDFGKVTQPWRHIYILYP